MRTTLAHEQSALIKRRADEKIKPLTVSIDDKGNVRVLDCDVRDKKLTEDTTSLWNLVFGDNAPRTPEDKLEFLQNDPDIFKFNGDPHALMCRGCSRTLVFDFPDRINIVSWLRHKVICKAVQRRYKKEYQEEARLHIKKEEVDIPLSRSGVSVIAFSASTSARSVSTPHEVERDSAPHWQASSITITRLSRTRRGNSKTPEEERRKKILDDDPLVGRVEETRVWCKPCQRWIGGTIGIYSLVNWRHHRKAKHEDNVLAPRQHISRLELKAEKPSTTIRSLRSKKSTAKHGEKKCGRDHGLLPVRTQVQRKRRIIESDDGIQVQAKDVGPKETLNNSVDLGEESSSWLRKAVNGLDYLWSIISDIE